MSSKNKLLVTFPVDLGNRTLESNQHCIFQNDMDFFRFAERHADEMDIRKISQRASLVFRLKSAYKLRKTVRNYTREGKFILFNGLSPALFSFGIWKPGQTAIVFDWTRTLYPSVLGLSIKKNLVFRIQRAVLRKCSKYLCWTDAIMANLQQVYGIEQRFIHKVRAPFLVEKLHIYPRPTPTKPRVLFVGGDLKRKGGDILLEAWSKVIKDKCFLSMMTNDVSAKIDGVNYLPGIKYGSDLHKSTFRDHDILILPTHMDAYPQVIGEAAAAGLAVITTKYALGAKEVIDNGITGSIAESPEESIECLDKLLDDHLLIDLFKKNGFDLMHKKFSKESIRMDYLQAIDKSI